MEENYTSERRNDSVDVVALWRAICRKWYLFVGSVVVCVALVACYLKIAKPQYEVLADILVNEDEKKGSSGSLSSLMSGVSGGGFSLDGMIGGGSVNDEILVISSHTIIREMVQHGARVDTFLVGEKLITSSTAPVFPGVYKLTATEKSGEIKPVIRLSENVEKITTPCPKLLWRLFDMETGKAIADLMTTEDEDISACRSYRLFDPDYTWKQKEVENFVARQLLTPFFKDGKCVYRFPALKEVRDYCMQQVDSLWEEVLRFEYPHNYYVDLSQKLYEMKKNLIEEMSLKQ